MKVFSWSRRVVAATLVACALVSSAFGAPSHKTFTWRMNPYASTIVARGGGAYTGTAYLIHIGSSYAGKQSELETAFKNGGLNLNNLPEGMSLIHQAAVTSGGISEQEVTTPEELDSLNDYWVMAVMFDGSYMLSGNIQQPIYGAYQLGNSYTGDGNHWVGPGSHTPPGPTLKVSVSSFVGAYDGKVHDLTYNGVTGHDSGTPLVQYSTDGVNYGDKASVAGVLPKDVTAGAVTLYVKASMAGYYDGFATGTITVTQRVVKVTAKSASKVFDGAPLTESGFTAPDFVAGEGITLAMTADSTITQVGAVSNVVDETSVAAKGATKLSNYKLVYEKGVLEVKLNETDLAAKATPYSGYYDGAAHTIGVEVTKKPAGSSPVVTYSTSKNGTYVTLPNFTQQKNATTAPVTVYAKVSLDGYKTVELSSTVSIAKRTVTVTADSASRPYNGSTLTCTTYKISPEVPTTTAGFVAGEGLSGVQNSSGICNPGTVNNVISRVYCASGTNKDNYDFTLMPGTLTVTVNENGPKATAVNYEGTYDNKGHLPTVTITDKPASGTPVVKYSLDPAGPFVTESEFELPKAAGAAVTVYVEVSQTGYKSYVTSATVKIDRRPVILVAGSSTKVYDGTPLAYAGFSVKSNPDSALYPVYGFTGGDGVKSVKMTAGSTITDVGKADNVIDPGQIVPYGTSDLSNYNIICEKGTLEVTTNTTGLKASVQEVKASYSGLATNVLVEVYKKPAGSNPTVTYSYSSEGPFVTADNFSAPVRGTGSAVKIWVKVSLKNYADVILQSAVTIAKRTVILVADNAEWEYDHLPHACGTWHVKDDPGTYDAYGFLPGEGVESLTMKSSSTVTRPPCDEWGCSPIDNVIDEASLVAKEGTDLNDYTILFEKGTLTIKTKPDTFLWLRYHDTLIVDNWGNPFTGKAYLIDYGVIPSPSNVGVSPDEQALEWAFTSDEGIDLDDLICRPAPSGEKLKVVLSVNIKDGEFIDTPDHTIEVHASTTNWYKMVFFMDSRTPEGDKKYDMYRGYAGAQWPRDTGYLKFPYQLNYRTTEEIKAGTGYPDFGVNWNHWAYVGPGKFKGTPPPVVKGDALLTAKLAWAQNFDLTTNPQYTGTGTFFARLEVACTNDCASELTSVRLDFADRVETIDLELPSVTIHTTATNFLYDTQAKTPLATTETFSDVVYRSYALDVAKIKAAAQGVFVRFGPASVTGTKVEVADRQGTPEMSDASRNNPSRLETGTFATLADNLRYCWLVWETNGKTFSMPVSSVDGAHATVEGGIPVTAPLPKLAKMSAAALNAKPDVTLNSIAAFNKSVAYGVPVTDDSDTTCRFDEFSIAGDAISGRVAVAAGEYEGVPSAYAKVTLLGAAKLGEEFVEVAEVQTGEDGSFTLTKPAGYAFFKIRLSVSSDYIH